MRPMRVVCPPTNRSSLWGSELFSAVDLRRSFVIGRSAGVTLLGEHDAT